MVLHPAVVRGTILAIGISVIPALATAATTHVRVQAHLGNGAARSSGGFMSPEAANRKSSVVFVSDGINNAVYVYPAMHIDAAPIGEITAGIDSPAGLAVDSNGVLYVANTNSSTISEYEPGATQPFLTIKRGVANPVALAVSADGTLVVASGVTYEQPGKLAIYAKGSTVPTRRITVPLDGAYYMLMGGVAIDASDNIYLSYTTEYPDTKAQVVEYPANSSKAVSTGIQGGATGLALDSRGNLYVGFPTSIEVFAKGSLQPSTTITAGLTNVGLFTVTSSRVLYVPNQETSSGCQLEDGNITAFSRGHAPMGSGSSGLVDPLGMAFRSGSE
jgi:hypothetical protein